MKKAYILSWLLTLSLILFPCAAENTEDEAKTRIIFNRTNALVSGPGAIFDDHTLLITSPGTYQLSGILENGQIVINAGSISIVSNDDGVNANDQSDMYGMGGFGGPRNGRSQRDTPSRNENEKEKESGKEDTLRTCLTINGGYLYVNASGDGLDSNGDFIVNGGLTIVDGPDKSMNGALDFGSENGGSLSITGGTVLAIGTSGMVECFGSDSTQPSVSVNCNFRKGTVITVCDEYGRQILTHTAAKEGQSIVFSSPDFKTGDKVHITVGSTQKTAVAEISTRSSFGFGWR